MESSTCNNAADVIQRGWCTCDDVSMVLLPMPQENNNAGVQHKKSSAALGRVEPPAFTSAANYSATQTVEVIAAGPALNTNGKPRARRGSATDPQSVYARVIINAALQKPMIGKPSETPDGSAVSSSGIVNDERWCFEENFQ